MQSKGLSRVLSNTTVQKHPFFSASFLYGPTLTSIHDYWKNIALTRQTFVGKVMSLLFNVLSRCVIACLPRSKLGYHWPFKEIVWIFFPPLPGSYKAVGHLPGTVCLQCGGKARGASGSQATSPREGGGVSHACS